MSFKSQLYCKGVLLDYRKKKLIAKQLPPTVLPNEAQSTTNLSLSILCTISNERHVILFFKKYF